MRRFRRYSGPRHCCALNCGQGALLSANFGTVATTTITGFISVVTAAALKGMLKTGAPCQKILHCTHHQPRAVLYFPYCFPPPSHLVDLLTPLFNLFFAQ